MHSHKLGSRGFTLIASLMLLLIMSGVSIGLLMMVDTESKVGSQDTQNTLAFHAAEGGIEHMTSDLALMFQNILSPTVSQIQALSALAPANTAFMSYPVYTLTPAQNPDGTPAFNYGKVSSGPYQDLYAQILPVTLQVTTTTSLAGLGAVGDDVSMSRKVEVALVPVFQFGVFSDGDLSFFAGPNLDFAGRVHTNGDLFLLEGGGNAVTFHDKVTAWGNVIRWELPNGITAAASGHLGSVNILTAALGCDGVRPNCRDMGADTVNPTDESSVLPGSAPNTWTTGGQNPAWPTTISGGDYGTWVIDGNYGSVGGSGARKLSLPFINGTVGAATQPQPFEIIRRPPPGEAPNTPLGSSRLYNEAQIRVLLADTPADLPHGVGDPNNVRLANVGVNAKGVAAPTPVLPPLASGGTYNTYFATGTIAYPDPSQWNATPVNIAIPPTLPQDWPYVPQTPLPGYVTLTNDPGPPAAPVLVLGPAGNDGQNSLPLPVILAKCPGNPPVCPPPPAPKFYNGKYPFYPTLPVNTSTWNLLDGYLRVEYQPAGGGAPIAITQEWLNLGFARDLTPPTAPGANDINPNAILLFQEPAKRNLATAILDVKGSGPGPCSKVGGVWSCVKALPPEVTVDQKTFLPWYGDSTDVPSLSMFNWYPINFYDTREGEPRDAVPGGAATCTPAGIMNAVEIDVGNLKKWLNGTIPGSGNRVDFLTQNGYVLYFSDRRGMLPNPWGTQVDAPNTKTGDSGFEDSINTVSAVGAPDGVLQPAPPPLPPPAPAKPSPEDVNNNGQLDNFGAGNLGLGLGYGALPPYALNNSVNRQVINAAGAPDPYMTASRLPSCIIGQKNWVSGARHVLKLVDGSLGNVPVRLDNGLGGFTVASENPVYIQGDYNSSVADPTWATPAPPGPESVHAAAGVIADAVTLLSNQWSDLASLANPTNMGARPALTTYYRVAISGGKNMNFNVAGIPWAGGDFGTDGGLHNFLRLLENWGGQTLNYKGSLVSMYYSTYATGVDRDGGGTTYSPPIRTYTFDPLFTQPQNLPPGTPLFRDIDNLSYRQSFTAHTGCY
jgi:hypothetical protein